MMYSTVMLMLWDDRLHQGCAKNTENQENKHLRFIIPATKAMPFTTVNQAITAQNDYWWTTHHTHFQHSVWWGNIDELRWLLHLRGKPGVWSFQRTTAGLRRHLLSCVYYVRYGVSNSSEKLVAHHSRWHQSYLEKINLQVPSVVSRSHKYWFRN